MPLKTLGSMEKNQGRSGNRKHTYFFGPYHGLQQQQRVAEAIIFSLHFFSPIFEIVLKIIELAQFTMTSLSCDLKIM